jgi:outer membrane protein assembly factor BamB
LWEFGTGNLGWAPQPVVSEDGVVFYMEETYPTYLYAVNGQSGAQLWKAPLGFDLGFSGAAEAVVTVDEANALAYLVEEPFSGDGKLYAIDKQTGDIAWWMGQTTHGAEFTGNYVLLQDGKIYAAADVPIVPYPGHGDKMLRIDPATQTIEMAYDRPEPENYWDIEAYTLCDQKLVASFDYQYDPVKLVVAYDTYTSTIAWQQPFSETITGKIACNPDKGRIYVPTEPYLYALDMGTGAEIWKYVGYDQIFNPSVANGIVYFLSDTNIYALDEETKTMLYHYPLGYDAEETTQVAIADGMLFFSGNGGTCDLYALGFPGDYRVFLPVVLRYH